MFLHVLRVHLFTYVFAALACIQEMQAMFACWKKYDHNELKCGKELQAFEKCHQIYLVSRNVKEEPCQA